MARAAAMAVLRPVHVGGSSAGAVWGALREPSGSPSPAAGAAGGATGAAGASVGAIGAVGADPAYGMDWVTAHPRGAVSSVRLEVSSGVTGCSWVMATTLVPVAVRALCATCRGAEHRAQRAHRIHTACAGAPHKVPVVSLGT